MKLSLAILLLFAFLTTTIHALALPTSVVALGESSKALFKRKGGGGDHASASKGSKGGSSSGARKGFSSSKGHGPQPPKYGSGHFYTGGAHYPFRSGHKSSKHGIQPSYVGVSDSSFYYPGFWPYCAYAYPYPKPYTYHNLTSDKNETNPVDCLCAKYGVCGCDSNTDQEYIDKVANNVTVSRLAMVNNTQTLVINGSLPNGTKVSTKSSAAAPGLKQRLAEMGGFWPVVAIVGYMVWLL